jgi:hypothetical protein
MRLDEIGRLRLHSEIRFPENNTEGFSDNEVPATTKKLAQSDESSKVAFTLVQKAGENFWGWWNNESPVLPFP